MNFKAVLALPKTARSAQTHKSISFIWIVWSTLYVYLCLLPKKRQLFELKMQFIISFKFYLFCRIGTIAIVHYLVLEFQTLENSVFMYTAIPNRFSLWSFSHREKSCCHYRDGFAVNVSIQEGFVIKSGLWWRNYSKYRNSINRFYSYLNLEIVKTSNSCSKFHFFT